MLYYITIMTLMTYTDIFNEFKLYADFVENNEQSLSSINDMFLADIKYLNINIDLILKVLNDSDLSILSEEDLLKILVYLDLNKYINLNELIGNHCSNIVNGNINVDFIYKLLKINTNIYDLYINNLHILTRKNGYIEVVMAYKSDNYDLFKLLTISIPVLFNIIKTKNDNYIDSEYIDFDILTRDVTEIYNNNKKVYKYSKPFDMILCDIERKDAFDDAIFDKKTIWRQLFFVGSNKKLDITFKNEKCSNDYDSIPKEYCVFIDYTPLYYEDYIDLDKADTDYMNSFYFHFVAFNPKKVITEGEILKFKKGDIKYINFGPLEDDEDDYKYAYVIFEVPEYGKCSIVLDMNSREMEDEYKKYKENINNLLEELNSNRYYSPAELSESWSGIIEYINNKYNIPSENILSFCMSW